MVTTYHNRYGDAIKFERVDDNTVEMTGYIYYRAGWSNDYSKAYEAYVNENSNPSSSNLSLKIKLFKSNVEVVINIFDIVRYKFQYFLKLYQIALGTDLCLLLGPQHLGPLFLFLLRPILRQA